MSIEDILSHRIAVHMDYYRNGVFNIACTEAMSYILRVHNNIKSFNNKYVIVPTKTGTLCAPRWYIDYDDNMEIMLGGYATGDKCIATVMRNGEVCINMTYRFTNPITQETELSDICEELYPLILVLLNYDTIEELKNMRESDNYIQTEFTEQDLEKFLHENDFDSKPAEVVELK